MSPNSACDSFSQEDAHNRVRESHGGRGAGEGGMPTLSVTDRTTPNPVDDLFLSDLLIGTV